MDTPRTRALGPARSITSRKTTAVGSLTFIHNRQHTQHPPKGSKRKDAHQILRPAEPAAVRSVDVQVDVVLLELPNGVPDAVPVDLLGLGAFGDVEAGYDVCLVDG